VNKRAMQISFVKPQASAAGEVSEESTFEAKAIYVSAAAQNVLRGVASLIVTYVAADTVRSIIVAKATK
jgi:hypothetical protein